MEELTINIIENAWYVLVLCYTDSCNKCHFWESELSKLDWLNIATWKYNVSKDAEFCKTYDIMEVPTLLLFNNWRVVKRLNEIQNNEYVLTYFGLK